MKVLSFIRELFWPKLEGIPANYTHQIDCPQINDDGDKKTVLNLSLKMYDEQRERIKSIESKSVIFIGLFSSIIAIMSFVIKDYIGNSSLLDITITICFSIIIIYACKVMMFAIKALERKSYTTINEKTFLDNDDNHIVQNIINSIKKNYNAINQKVDNMTMAQEFIKRIIAIFTILACLMIIVSVYKLFSLYEINIPKFITALKNSTYFDLIVILVLVLLFIWNVIISIRIYLMSNKSNN